MKMLLILLLITGGSLFTESNVSMLGIKINDPQNVTKKISLKVVAREEGITKYATQNGNDFSLTVENGKVVYMENDWLQQSAGEKPLVSSFTFGKTTLRDIRKAFDTNGFQYQQRGDLTTDTDLVEFNCFDVDSPNNEVLVVITKVPLKTTVTETTVADNLKLDAVILANKDYLEAIWGKEKVADPNNKKVKL